MITTERSDINANARVRLGAVTTILTNIHEAFRQFLSYLYHGKVVGLSNKPHLNLISYKPSYHLGRISLMLLHTFPQGLVTLPCGILCQSRNGWHICIQVIATITLHPSNPLLPALADVWVSLFTKFVYYINHAYFINPNTTTALWCLTARARITECNITAQHALSWLYNQYKRSDDNSVILANIMQCFS